LLIRHRARARTTQTRALGRLETLENGPKRVRADDFKPFPSVETGGKRSAGGHTKWPEVKTPNAPE
jgi:hypothetical protein